MNLPAVITNSRPDNKSVTRRRKAAAEMRRKAAAYVALTEYERTEDADAALQRRHARILALGWVIARAQQALAMETGGLMGNRYATARTALGLTPEPQVAPVQAPPCAITE